MGRRANAKPLANFRCKRIWRSRSTWICSLASSRACSEAVPQAGALATLRSTGDFRRAAPDTEIMLRYQQQISFSEAKRGRRAASWMHALLRDGLAPIVPRSGIDAAL